MEHLDSDVAGIVLAKVFVDGSRRDEKETEMEWVLDVVWVSQVLDLALSSGVPVVGSSYDALHGVKYFCPHLPPPPFPHLVVHYLDDLGEHFLAEQRPLQQAVVLNTAGLLLLVVLHASPQ